MPKRKTSVATVTLEVLDDWQAAAQHVESHIAGTRGVHAAYHREDLSPWPIEAAETLRHKTAIVIEHIESCESLNVRAFLERIREAAATWVTKRNFVIQFREIRHADRDAAVAAMDKLARFTNDGLPCQERLSLDLSIAEGAIWLAQFPLLAERTNGQPPFIIRHNLIRWVSWVQGAFSSAIHDWAVPGIAAIRPRQEGKRTSGASMESRERWELANVVFPRIVCDTNRTPKKLAIAEARRVGDLDVALPRIDRLLESLEAFVMQAARWPQGNLQPERTEDLMRAVTALDELVGAAEAADRRPQAPGSPAPTAVPAAECEEAAAIGKGQGNPTRDVADSHGYVETPADPSAYVPAVDIMTSHTPENAGITVKHVSKIVGDFTANRVRWTRPTDKQGKPIVNRRSVHLGDWAGYLKRQAGTDEEGFPRLGDAEIERRKKAVRNTERGR